MTLLCLYSSKSVNALPPLPTEFYGHVRDYNMNASQGEIIYAYDSSGVLCGSFKMVYSGSYGSLTCKGDDPETAADEGATSGENITFRYKGAFTMIQGDNSWDYGVFRYVNISYPLVFCGDLFCDAMYESYYTCPSDCPFSNASTNATTNRTTNGTTNGSGQGQGQGSESGESTPWGLIPQAYLNFSGWNFSGLEGFGFGCEESWMCSNWSECRIDGFQNRTCTDKNSCGTFENKPPEAQKCFYTPTCFDRAKNGLEEGIDCGGLCPSCITCFDSIQNCHSGSCEEDVDCGGPCLKCPTCFDNVQNCHGGSCEEGLDCNGPCEKKCPALQLALLQFECKKDINPLSNQSILFFIILVIIVLIDIIYSKGKIKELRKNKELSDIKRAKKILSARRRMYLLIVIILVIAIVLYLYYYFFIMCEIGYRFLWLLLLILFVAPILIHEVIRYLEYTEDKRLKKLEILLNTHYKQIENLLKIENENLSELEEELSVDLYKLLEKPEYKRKENLIEAPLLKEIYKRLVILYSKYKEKENPVMNEKILCDGIYSLVENEKYKPIIALDLNLQNIVFKLKILYKQYEEKQKFYDELSKIENSKEELKEETKEQRDKKK